MVAIQGKPIAVTLKPAENCQYADFPNLRTPPKTPATLVGASADRVFRGLFEPGLRLQKRNPLRLTIPAFCEKATSILAGTKIFLTK
jgi:hypothetical protein